MLTAVRDQTPLWCCWALTVPARDQETIKGLLDFQAGYRERPGYPDSRTIDASGSRGRAGIADYDAWLLQSSSTRYWDSRGFHLGIPQIEGLGPIFFPCDRGTYLT